MERNRERRRFPRHESEFFIRYKDAHDPNAKWDIAQAKNISLGGMLFSTGEEFPSETILLTKFQVPTLASEEPIEFLAKVAFVKKGTTICSTGVSFYGSNTTARAKIRKFVSFLSTH